MRTRTETHAAQITEMGIVPHLRDEGVGANGEIGERNGLRTHEVKPIQHIENAEGISVPIVYRTNPVVNQREPYSAPNTRFQLPDT
jgi:hypothetical protein